MNHTPGPWEIVRTEDPHADESAILVPEKVGPFEISWHDASNTQDGWKVFEADVALVAAAPDLLKAAQEILEANESDNVLARVRGFQSLSAAVLKASAPATSRNLQEKA